ncbi:EamA family transporter [Halobacteria archaeon AArc-curdl1]|uniref:EamA family transporter n=1 Tax=Natronosalvus hydrolyticus TaxID=2979988 RepID=A0AAP3E6Q9_9EURY|nr:EamA family transporter [Halobacteria archaeon AArc-curdl1]
MDAQSTEDVPSDSSSTAEFLARYLFALAPLAAATLWGGLYVVSKWGFEAVPPVTLAFARVAVGATALWIVVRLTYPRRSFSKRDLLAFAGLGVLVSGSLITQFLGTDLTTASQGSLITVSTPVFTVLLGVALLDERLSARAALGIGIATVGTLLVLSGQYDLTAIAGAATTGILLLLVASATWAGYTVYGKPLIERYSALETATYSTVAAVPVLALMVPVELAVTDTSLSSIPLSLPVLVAIAYLGLFGTAAAWYLWYKGLEYVDASIISVFFFAQPVVGGLLGAAFLGEQLGSLFVVGGVVMAAGVYLIAAEES